MRKLRLAAVGGGAVAEAVHLPALTLSGQAEAAILIDKSLPRAAALAAQFGVPAVAADYREVIGRADAAVVGLPHHLHAEVACDLLRHGLHVLVEKPMALRARDCDAMLEAAAGSGCVLTVGLLRRFSESLRFVKQALDGGLIGKVLSFDLREGGVYGWPVASDAMFRPEAGGVLADAGAHALDLVLWWLGECQRVEYYDDAMGGVEAGCEVHLEMKGGARAAAVQRSKEMLTSMWKGLKLDPGTGAA